jgi:hypothetical protein
MVLGRFARFEALSIVFAIGALGSGEEDAELGSAGAVAGESDENVRFAA